MFVSHMGYSEAADQLAYLRETNIDKIMTFNRSAPPPPGGPETGPGMWFEPLVDGDFIRGPQQEAFEAGKLVKVP